MAQQALVFLLELVDLVGAIDDELQDIGVYRLLVEIVSPEANGLHGIVLVTMARHDNDLRRRGKPEDLLQRGKAFRDALRIRRQAKVLQDHRRLVPAQLGKCGFAVLGYQHFVILKAPAQLALQPPVVLHHQQPPPLFAHPLPLASVLGRRQFRQRQPDGNTGALAWLRLNAQRATGVNHQAARLVRTDAHALAALG